MNQTTDPRRHDMKISPCKSLLLILALATIMAGCVASKEWTWDGETQLRDGAPPSVQTMLRGLKKSALARATITLPYDGTIFPPEIAATEIRWADDTPGVEQWFIAITFDNGRAPIYAYRNTPRFTPDRPLWESIKSNSVGWPAHIAVYGLGKEGQARSMARKVAFTTSTDSLDATVMYRQVPLKFEVTEANFRRLKWRLGDIASYDEPPVIMENLSTCASCHLASKDGRLLSMEMNYKGDSGAHFVAEVSENMVLGDDDFMTWSDFPKMEVLPKTRGLSAKLSPSGKYMVGTVNEISYAAVTNDPAFSQLFFPTYGILGVYSRETKQFKPLPGASDTAFVQTDPSWSRDEQHIAFSRAVSVNEYHENIWRMKTHVVDRTVHDLNDEFPIQFNIHTLPFNEGTGGMPTPLKGASDNGMSNYFPRYSPDGKWIVFTRSKSGIMLQPDSRLYIVPAQGGEAREMRCNRALFNSWHSFSPNGRWMVFSSKVNTPYTEIFLTHIDENGMDSPPVLLSRFSDNEYAANLPELVNIKPGALKTINVTNHH